MKERKKEKGGNESKRFQKSKQEFGGISKQEFWGILLVCIYYIIIILN